MRWILKPHRLISEHNAGCMLKPWLCHRAISPVLNLDIVQGTQHWQPLSLNWSFQLHCSYTPIHKRKKRNKSPPSRYLNVSNSLQLLICVHSRQITWDQVCSEGAEANPVFNYHGPGELCLLGSNWTVFVLPHQDVVKELIRRKGSMLALTL